MRKYIPFFLIIIFVILVVSAGILYFVFILPEQRQKLEPYPVKPSEPGEVILTYSEAQPNQKEYLRTAILNGVTIEDFNFTEADINGQMKSLLNLTISFNYKGVSRKLTVPIVESIALMIKTKTGFDEKGQVNINSLNLKKGGLVNVAFSFVPNGSEVAKEDIIKYCKERDLRLCIAYIDLGFGSYPVNFDNFLIELLSKGNPETDYRVAFPNTISFLTN